MEGVRIINAFLPEKAEKRFTGSCTAEFWGEGGGEEYGKIRRAL